jgi:hypothetical protein
VVIVPFWPTVTHWEPLQAASYAVPVTAVVVLMVKPGALLSVAPIVDEIVM